MDKTQAAVLSRAVAVGLIKMQRAESDWSSEGRADGDVGGNACCKKV